MNPCQSHKFYNNMSNKRIERNIQCNEKNTMYNNSNRSFNMVKTSAQPYKHIIHACVYNTYTMQ